MKTYSEFIKEAAKIVGKIDLPANQLKVTKNDLNQLEKVLDRLFAHYKIDIEFTRHFLDRVNDPRNKKQITIKELRDLYKATYRKYGKQLANMKNIEAVLKDLQSNINIPFKLEWDKKNNEVDLVAKTTMRKKNFKTSNKEFKV